jgi:hypothetical protein
MLTVIKRISFGNEVKVFKLKSGIGKGVNILLNPVTESSKIIGLYEKEIQTYFRRYSKSSNVLLDIGSYDGYYSLIYRKYNKEGGIFACEAGERIIDQLKENYKMNSEVSNAFQVVNSFIGNKEGKDMTCIDSICRDFYGKNILFKIDVEGAELEVLKGGLTTFKKNNSKFIIETHSKELESKCFQLLDEQNFQVKIIKNSFFSRVRNTGRILEHNRWLVAKKRSI